MNARYWADTDDDPDRKRRRQAEFLVHKKFPWEMIEIIAVMNNKIKNEVEGFISKALQQPPIKIKPDWYY